MFAQEHSILVTHPCMSASRRFRSNGLSHSELAVQRFIGQRVMSIAHPEPFVDSSSKSLTWPGLQTYIDAAPLATQMSKKPRPKRMKHMDNPKFTCSRARGGRHCNPFPSTDDTIETNRRFNPFHSTDGTTETNRHFPRSCR